MSKEAMKLALEALDNLRRLPQWTHTAIGIRDVIQAQITTLREALAEDVPEVGFGNTALDKIAENARELGLDYEPDGMHHNKPQKRPQNCGTGYCSCIECVMEPAQQEPVAHVMFRQDEDGLEPVMFCGPGTAPDPATLKDRFVLKDVWLSPPAQRKPLTRKQLADAWIGTAHITHATERQIAYARAIEAKLKEKNT